MIDGAIVIPATTPNAAAYAMSATAIRTCRASTDTPMLVLHNTTPEGPWRDRFRKECELLDIQYQYVPGFFSISKCFNLGTQMTTGKYVALGCADVVYYPHWLENIVELWEENPEYFCLCNYTFDSDGGHPCARTSTVPIRAILPSANPSSGVIVMKRENGYVWDEHFALWEMDADLFYYLEANKLKAGVCLNARCDHMICGNRNLISEKNHFDDKIESSESGRYLRQKWKNYFKG